MRIVSLVPSLTETLTAWDRVPIACTRFCERPDLEHVGGTKNPDVSRIEALRPDLIVMDAEENRREDYDALLDRDLRVCVVHIRSLVDVNPSMEELALSVGATWRSVEFGQPLPTRLRAFIPIWRHPWMALGTPTYGSSLLQQLGVENVNEADGAYPQVELDDARSRYPDVVLAPSEPYPFSDRQLPELGLVAPTYFVDGKDLFWWGHRTHDALVRLAATIDAICTAST
ncbi:MAG TPA: helical backbone metal receptor [Acidimicrobiales bacterium]|nr:helical backbone metal receptor [Acidimicrobiales bacterium]